MVQLVLVISLLISVIVVIYFIWSFEYWKRRGVKAPPTSFPFGNAAKLFLQQASLSELLKDIYLKYKSKGWNFCGFYFLTKPTLLVFNPELVKTILTKDFSHFTGHGMYMNEKDDPVSAHLFALQDEKWRYFRTKLAPSFSSGKVKMMFQTLVDCSEQLKAVMDKAVRDREAVDMQDIALRYTVDSITSCAFGIECNSVADPKSEFINYAKIMAGEGSIMQHLKNLVSVTMPSLLTFFHIPLNNADVSKFFINIVRETINYREKNNVIRKDFMHLLIQMKNNVTIEDREDVGELRNKTVSEDTLTVEQMAAQVWLFYGGGFSTSGATIAFCLFELASNVEIQETLRKEIMKVLAKHNGKITYDAVTEMAYLDQCVNETLRKHPPAPLLSRECNQTYNIPDSEIILEKGTTVFIPIMGIHNDPEFFPDPEKFDPARFSPENKSKQLPYTWLPFGEGPRICIGLRFGLMEVKVALTALLKNYKFTMNPKTTVPLVMKPGSIVLSIKEGLWLNTEHV